VFVNKSQALEKIVKGCIKGERSAQKALFDRFAPKMLSICLRDVSEQQAAEDLMIIAFTKVFKRIEQIKTHNSVEFWIRKIMINESLMFIRANKSVHLVSESNIISCEQHAHEIYSNYDADQLMELVRKLPHGYRTVFNLYAIDGYSHQDIADQLGISVSTSKSQLHKARVLLQNQIDKLEKKRIRRNKSWISLAAYLKNNWRIIK